MRPTDVIFLTRQDTIDTACELLRRARTSAQVWMVLPWRTPLARQLFGLKRLASIAADEGLELRLVSRDGQARTLARTAGIPVRSSLPAAVRKLESTEITRSSDLGRRVQPLEEPLGRRDQRVPARFNLWTVLVGLGFIALLLAVMVGVVAVFLPSAELVLSPVSTTEQVRFTVQANPRYDAIDAELGLVPLRSVQVIVEGSAETPATGTTDVAEGYASGEVVFTNRTADAITIPEGTVVRSGSGDAMRFRTTSEVNLPAGPSATARAPVQAVEPGYAMAGANTLTRVEGTLASQVEVSNDGSIGGGGSRRVPIIAYPDLDQLQAMLVEQLQKAAYDELVSQLSADEFVPPSTLTVEIMSMQYDQAPLQRSDVLSGRMRLVVRGSAVNQYHLRRLAEARIHEAAGGDVEIIGDSLSVEQLGDSRMDESWLEFDLGARAEVVPALDYGWVRDATRGRTIEQAIDWLHQNLNLVSAPRVTVTPEGWQRLPLLDDRFSITLSSQP
ncbi:MAG: hypothetical protein ACOX2L_05075 [Anaerolineae bacterium]|nr:hypothetical protein [Chloroflexota bacterium]